MFKQPARFLLVISLTITFILLNQTTTASTYWPLQDMLSPSGTGSPSGESYFYQVAVDGDTAVVTYADDSFLTGAAYVFIRSGTTWTQQAKLTADNGRIGDELGTAVDISGNTIVVAAVRDLGLNYGSVYVFTRVGTTWTQKAELTGYGSHFGDSVAIDGSILLVGSVTGSGKAYVFRGSGPSWTQEAVLVAEDSASYDGFGSSLGIASGEFVLIGAPGDDDKGENSGSVYVFEPGIEEGIPTWVQSQKLTASDGAEGDRFGWSMDIYGHNAVIGADEDDDNGENSGSAYLFSNTTAGWTGYKKLTPSDGASGDRFGRSVAISIKDDRVVVIGASNSAYVFDSVSEDQYKFTSPDGSWDFGNSVGVDGDTTVIGALDRSLPSAYVYVRASPSNSLTAGWNMISSYINPNNPNLEDIFSSIKDDMILVKNAHGLVYWPAYNVNQIGDWDPHQGYQVYMETDALLDIAGEQLDPATTPIFLPAGWSLIAYLRDTPLAIEDALADVTSDLVLVKDNLGHVYWPDLSINNIGDMVPGQGYQFYIDNNATLTYPAND